MVVGGPLFIAGGQAPKLFTSIDEALDAMAQAVEGAMKRPLVTFILLAGDGDSDAMLARILANLPAAVPFITHDTTRSALGAADPRRLTAPVSRSGSKTVASWRCPGVRMTVMSWPFPSARRWTWVLNPPRLRPRASDAGSLFLPQPRVGGLGSWCHRHHGGPSSVGQRHRLALAPLPRAGSRCPPAANGRSDWPRYATGHSARAAPARGHRCAESIKCH
jgi:hypothetical protein